VSSSIRADGRESQASISAPIGTAVHRNRALNIWRLVAIYGGSSHANLNVARGLVSKASVASGYGCG